MWKTIQIISSNGNFIKAATLLFLFACHLHSVLPLPSLQREKTTTGKRSLAGELCYLEMRPTFIAIPSIFPRTLSKKCRNHNFVHVQQTRRTVSATATVTPTQRISVKATPSKVICVGDIHGQWDEFDESAIRNLNPDLVLFVGDYGNEDVVITRRVAQFAATAEFGVATVFGNHDSFYTQSVSGMRRAPYNKSEECRVTTQMEIMAPYDVSYRSAGFDKLGISVCGGRSFSVGGPNWKYSEFYRRFIGVYGIDHSATKLKEAVARTQFESLIFLSHSGPVGLGKLPNDPCGKDWGTEPGGDYGDRDLRAAIETARQLGLRVPLTVFGHMHRTLMNDQGDRIMLKTEPDGNTGQLTVMLNAAVFPRHGVHSTGFKLRHFQVVQIGESGYVDSVKETWASPEGEVFRSIDLFEATDHQALSVSASTLAGVN